MNILLLSLLCGVCWSWCAMCGLLDCLKPRFSISSEVDINGDGVRTYSSTDDGTDRQAPAAHKLLGGGAVWDTTQEVTVFVYQFKKHKWYRMRPYSEKKSDWNKLDAPPGIYKLIRSRSSVPSGVERLIRVLNYSNATYTDKCIVQLDVPHISFWYKFLTSKYHRFRFNYKKWLRYFNGDHSELIKRYPNPYYQLPATPISIMNGGARNGGAGERVDPHPTDPYPTYPPPTYDEEGLPSYTDATNPRNAGVYLVVDPATGEAGDDGGQDNYAYAEEYSSFFG